MFCIFFFFQYVTNNVDDFVKIVFLCFIDAFFNLRIEFSYIIFSDFPHFNPEGCEVN